MRAAPNDTRANQMRATVLKGQGDAWEAESRSAAELKEAATYFDRAAALCNAPAVKADLAERAIGALHMSRSLAELAQLERERVALETQWRRR